jgi:hypothetical protein
LDVGSGLSPLELSVFRPPNYENEAFYKDLGLLDEKPKTKNPIVDVLRNVGK